MIVAGIDAGSRTIKVVLLDGDGGPVRGMGMADQGVDQDTLANDLLERVLDDARLRRDDVGRIVATGYGRHLLGFADEAITEITCHAVGVRRQVPGVRTVLEMGGQDSKVVRLRAEGAVRDFSMNDRCAAGTGRFLEVVAERLGLDLEELGVCASRSRRSAAISSMCVVFAETEIIGLLAHGVPPEDIAAGVQSSIATRLASLAGRSLEDPVAFTGGVALVPGMPRAVEEVLGRSLTVPETPQFTGALGAATLAAPSNGS